MLCSSCRSPIATRLLTKLAELAVARRSHRLFHASTGRAVVAEPGHVPHLGRGSLRAGTVISHNPLSTTSDDILSSILPSGSSSRLSSQSSTGVLLCSRAFAGLASDADFLQNFITRLAGTHETGSRTGLGWSVNVLSAVVDHVSSPTAKSSSHQGAIQDRSSYTSSKAPVEPSNSFEGITYLFDVTGQTLGLNEAFAANSTLEPDATPQDEPGYVSLRTSNSSLDPHRITTLQLPLANTLFVNGSSSTMVISQWSIGKDGKSLVNDNAQPRATFCIDLPDKSSATSSKWGFPASTSLHVPIKALTPPRIVSDSSGNVVRRLQSDKSVPQSASSPASLELEQAIAQYFSELDMAPQSIPVWGLVVPDKLGNSVSDNDADPSLLIQRGASLHRVLSGGGGWGENAGLISLDYRNEFGRLSSSSDAHAPNFDENASNLRSSFGGAVVSPGDMLRFFILDTMSHHTPQLSNVSSSPMHHLVLQVGVSEAVDEDNSNGRASNQVEMAEPPSTTIETIDDHFGALSEAGIALSQISSDGTVFAKSKIDVPQATVSFNYAQPIGDQNGGVVNRHISHPFKRQQSGINDNTNVVRKYVGLPHKPQAFRKLFVGQSPASNPEAEPTTDEAPASVRITKFPAFSRASRKQFEEWRQFTARAKVKAYAAKHHTKWKFAERRRKRPSKLGDKIGTERSIRPVKSSSITSTERIEKQGHHRQHEASAEEREDEIFDLFNEVMGRRK